MLLMYKLVYMLPTLYFFIDLAVLIVLIRRGYWYFLLYVVLLVVNIPVIVRKVFVSLLSGHNYYIRTLLIVDVLSKFQGD